MSKLTKSFKGQIKEARDKAIWIDVVADELFSTWIPKSALDMTKMDENYLTVTGMQTFHVKQWFLDLKAKEADSKAQFMEKAEEISTNGPDYTPKENKQILDRAKSNKIPRIPDMIYDKKGLDPNLPDRPSFPPKTQTVMMPSAPTPDRVEFPYFPDMSILELRDYHMHEPVGAIRGHIENIIMRKEDRIRREEVWKELLEGKK